MLALEDLSLNAIGRFVEEQSIDFSSLADFIQIDGQNNNTKSSSGSGKTTVLNALDYLLGLNDTPATILQSRFTEDHITVSGNFNWNGKPLFISRGKKLKINIDGNTIEGSSALAEEKLDEILGMPRKIFRKLIHKRQKEGGFFLDFTPQKMHEFLVGCLNLSEFRKHDEKMDEKISDLSDKLAEEESSLSGKEIGLQVTIEAIALLGDGPPKEVTRETILELKEKVDQSTIRFEDVKNRLESETRELGLQRPNINVVQYDGNIRETLEARRKEIEASVSACLEEERERQRTIRGTISEKISEKSKLEHIIGTGSRSKDEATKIAAEIKQIRAKKCPTCEQDWKVEDNSKAEQAKLQQLVELKERIIAASKAEISKYTLEEQIAALDSRLEPQISPKEPVLKKELVTITQAILEEKRKADETYGQQNAATKKLMDDFAKKQSSLALQHGLEMDQARGDLDLARRVFDGAKQKYRAYEEALTRHATNYSSLKVKEENFTKNIEEIKANIVSISKKLRLAQEAKKAIKTFLSHSFDGAIEEIGNRATEIIRCIPNMSNATIKFDSTKENAKGVVKEEVNAVIGMDGEESVPIKSLSGGERTATDLAVDLAVVDFIETKSGKGFNLLGLDEPFNGLGPVETEMVLEILKNSNTNKKIIIVSHDSEVKQMVQNRIVVVRDGLTSRIEKGA